MDQIKQKEPRREQARHDCVLKKKGAAEIGGRKGDLRNEIREATTKPRRPKGGQGPVGSNVILSPL